MKKFLLFVFTLAMCGGTASAALTALHIHTSSHGVITLMLDEQPELTFNDDRSITVAVKADPTVEPVSISFDDVESCNYGDKDDYSSVSVPVSDAEAETAVMVKIGADAVTFSGISDDAAVEVYSLAGVKMAGGTAADGTYTLRRDALTHGVYIVRIGKFVTKLSL